MKCLFVALGLLASSSAWAQACRQTITCPATHVCDVARSICIPAVGQRYRLTFNEGFISTRNPRAVVGGAKNGGWDIAGGAPDGMIVITQDGREVGRTRATKDSFNPKWNTYVDVVLRSGSTLAFHMYDEDVGGQEWDVGFEFKGNQALEALARLSGAGMQTSGDIAGNSIFGHIDLPGH